MKKQLLLFFVIAPMLGILLAGARVYYMIHHQGYEGDQTIFEVRRGEGFASINYRLHQAGIINNARIFHRYNQYKNQMERFRAGRYLIKPGDTMSDIASTLVRGAGLTTRVTIPEGYNLFQIAEMLEKNSVTSAEEFIRYARDPEFLLTLGVDAPRIEGYLFPETYFLQEDMPAKEVIARMHQEFIRQTAQLNLSHPQLSAHELVILASIVEKETGAPWERAKIAGVFFNRIDRGMRLQSDPTTIYGMFETFDGRIRRSDLQRVTPYNTYRINGLPKGPIANPGLDALRAVLAPEEHNYLYFVSRNDGTHVFSKNLRDHNNAVNYWQRNPENRRGRSWRDLDQSPHNPNNQPDHP